MHWQQQPEECHQYGLEMPPGQAVLFLQEESQLQAHTHEFRLGDQEGTKRGNGFIERCGLRPPAGAWPRRWLSCPRGSASRCCGPVHRQGCRLPEQAGRRGSGSRAVDPAREHPLAGKVPEESSPSDGWSRAKVRDDYRPGSAKGKNPRRTVQARRGLGLVARGDSLV